MLRTGGSRNLLGLLARWWSQLNPLLRFGLKFCFLLGLYYALSVTPWSDRPLSVCLSANARVCNWVLVGLGQKSHVTGSTISGPAVSLTVQRGCDALDSLWLLCAGMLAYPVSWRSKTIGILLGVAAIVFINIVRILSLYAVMLKAPALFETIHIEIWPIAFVILAGLLWIVWIRWALKNEDRRHATT
jgi:exosortase/archaeosortase family protein